jgi:2-polyprenyl-3-methyl-5-hydroxy-6-metoxy-1,4-benzoquinol methylase
MQTEDMDTHDGEAKRTSCGFCFKGNVADAQECRAIPSPIRAFRSESFPVWRCRNCGSLHSLNVVDLDHYYAHYPRRDIDQPTFLTRCAYANLVRKLERAGLNPNSRILDYGCGNGDLITYLRECGYSTVRGYDPFVTEFASQDVLHDRYDTVIAKDVFEHLENGKKALSEWKNLLQPGGMLCLTLPNANGVYLKTSGRMLHSLHQPYHLHIPTVAQLEAMTNELGFKTLRIEERSYWDTPIPMVNRFFIFEFLRTGDNTVDVAFEAPRIFRIMTSPRLWFYGLFGYFLPNRAEMIAIVQS